MTFYISKISNRYGEINIHVVSHIQLIHAYIYFLLCFSSLTKSKNESLLGFRAFILTSTIENSSGGVNKGLGYCIGIK